VYLKSGFSPSGSTIYYITQKYVRENPHVFMLKFNNKLTFLKEYMKERYIDISDGN